MHNKIKNVRFGLEMHVLSIPSR